MASSQDPPDVAMAGGPPNVAVNEPVAGPDLIHSPSGSSSSASHASFDPGDVPSDEQCTDYSAVFPGEWLQSDADGLYGLGWVRTPGIFQVSWQPFVPYWSRPGWEPGTEYTLDGSKQRATRGDREISMRPAILPRDRGVLRTRYTRRWGMYPPMGRTQLNEARSGLTPTFAAPGPDGTRQWTHEESFQSYFWDGFTTQELVDVGAYAPDLYVPAPDDQTTRLHPLFDRDRWAQPQADEGLGGGLGKMRRFDLDYFLNGARGTFDAERDDAVWAALQPSLRIASNVIMSQHPMWLMFLRGIYHMRKVPRESDGRTDMEKIEENYRQYRTLWPEIDEAQMYDNARRLWYAGFDPGQATGWILHHGLKWGLLDQQPHSNACTFTDPDWCIHIFLNANSIWPLISDEYSESEKVGIRVKLATTILHELSHACHQAHHQMLEQPRRFIENVPGMPLTREIETLLTDLRVEAIGTGTRSDNGRQYFVETDVSMEEGKAFDFRLWGCIPEYHPPLSGQPSTFRPMISARDWPFAHPKVYHQNIEAVRAGAYDDFTRTPYNAFLLFPRAPVYELYTPLPISNFSHLTQSSWWNGDFQRFGPRSLNIGSTRTDQNYPLQSGVYFRYSDFKALLMSLVGNKSVCRFVFTTAPNILARQNHLMILAWLSKVSLDIAGSKIMRLRLHYERRTWDDKYGRIHTLCDQVVRDASSTANSLVIYLSDLPLDDEGQIVDRDEVTRMLDDLLRQDALELNRLLDYESRYAQCLAAEYFLKDVEDRSLVRRSMHILLRHLQETCDWAGAALASLLDVWSKMGAGVAFAAQRAESEALYARINASQTAIFEVVRILRGNTLTERSGPAGHGPLAAVPAASREFKLGRSFRAAAMAEFARVTDSRIRRLVNTWLNLIHFSQDIRHDDPAAEDVVVGGGSIAELRRGRDQAMADALGIAFLDRQEQVEANRAQGMPPNADEARIVGEMQQEMADLESQSDIVDLYLQSFSDEERERLRRGYI